MKRLALCALPLLAGCAALNYYAQAVNGHFDVLSRAVPIEQRLLDAQTSPALKIKLARLLEVREFASRELHLPDNAAYRSYAELDRPFVVWNVFAAPEFSVAPVQSCFFFAGCVGYRGYYAEAAAEQGAQELARRGYDVYVGGVPAYSTLGWFDDPALSTFIGYPEAEIARVVFHELAHQVAYVKDDSVFNESFAVAVEEEGVRRWLAHNGTPAQRADYAEQQHRRAALSALLLDYRSRLAAFYAQNGAVEEKRAGKARIFAQMLEDYRALRSSWGGFAGYDRLFAKQPNNALLASVAAYTDRVPVFRALLAQKQGDLRAFYGAVRELARMDKPERDARLDALTKAAA